MLAWLEHDLVLEESICSMLIKENAYTEENLRCLRYWVIWTDNCLGGMGTSICRIFMAGFKYPAVETLASCKIIYEYTDDPVLKQMALNVFDPPLADPSVKSLLKMVEAPDSINTKKQGSATETLRKLVKDSLKASQAGIKNKRLRAMLTFSESDENRFMANIQSLNYIQPKTVSNL